METTIDVSLMKKLIITVAQTGGIHGKKANPGLPEQPDEIAQSAYDCYNAGASICHIHVRDKEGRTTADHKVYGEVLSKIKAKSPIITQVGNGIGRYFKPDGSFTRATLADRMRLTELDPKPDMLTINSGTFEFGWAGSIFENPIAFNEEFVKKCNARGIGIECEVYDLGQIVNVMELVNRGALKKPTHFSFVLGIKGGIPATPKTIISMVDLIPEGSTWQVITISKLQVPSTVIALSMGANIRTGLEDNIYYSRGVLAKSNAQLVERMANIAKTAGREIATVQEARKILGLPS